VAPPLLACQDLAKAFGAAPLFEGLSFGLFQGDHVGVIGPNGAGKSTLLRILAGLEEPSAGTRSVRRGLRIGFAEQDPAFPPDASVESLLRAAAAEVPAHDADLERRVSRALGRAGFDDPARGVKTLSGGWRKRLAIARELVREPDLLLLDEPTNHLDVEGILWLEEVLREDPQAFVAVSHDRYFLEAVAGRVLEINRAFAGGLLDVAGTYSDHLERKDEVLKSQQSYQESLRNRVRGELDWLSRKARARTRKAQARIDEAGRLQDELQDLDARSADRTASVQFADTDRQTKRLVVAEGLAKSLGGRALVRGLDLVLSPGHRLGLLGRNGSGKTTLLRLLAGREAPDAGTVVHADKLQVVYFDQHRARLDPEAPLRRALSPFGDAVVFDGRSIHVAGWAKRFLFRSEQLDTPVGRLSGGEQARVAIARLVLEPADVLLLDEPTNDLDIPTLEVLEESLLAFRGALVLVTHDRYLLDRVSTRILALDGEGGAVAYADYAQWEAAQRADARAGAEAAAAASDVPAARSAPARAKKLGYLEQREWEQMEARILDAETRLSSARTAAEDPAVASDHTALGARLSALAEAQTDLDRLYERWAELEAKGGGR
jgi:ATP-binding cassette subfamily F protein uup